MVNAPVRYKHSPRCPLCLLNTKQIRNVFIAIVTHGWTDEERLRFYRIADNAMLPRSEGEAHPDDRV